MSKIWSTIRKSSLATRRRTYLESSGANPWDEEINLYKQDVMHFGHFFITQRNHVREEALMHLGHAAYADGPEAASCALPFIPHIIGIIKASRTADAVPDSLTVQALQTLSELCQCHRNRSLQDQVGNDHQATEAILNMTDTVLNLRLSRWAAYLLHVPVMENEQVIGKVRQMPDVLRKLKNAADFPRGWEPWGYNIPRLLITVTLLLAKAVCFQ